jgi:hypothetical protein
VGCRKASGFATRLDEESMVAGCKVIGGGWVELTESVWEDMEVSGENEGGAILLVAKAGC